MAHGFPNMFVVAGRVRPRCWANVMVSIEQHVDWVSALLVDSEGAGTPVIEVTAEAEAGWVDHVNAAAAPTLYMEAASYYLGARSRASPGCSCPTPAACAATAGSATRWPPTATAGSRGPGTDPRAQLSLTVRRGGTAADRAGR